MSHARTHARTYVRTHAKGSRAKRVNNVRRQLGQYCRSCPSFAFNHLASSYFLILAYMKTKHESLIASPIEATWHARHKFSASLVVFFGDSSLDRSRYIIKREIAFKGKNISPNTILSILEIMLLNIKNVWIIVYVIYCNILCFLIPLQKGFYEQAVKYRDKLHMV